MLKEEIRENPKNDRLYGLLGHVYHNEGKLKEAEKLFIKSRRVRSFNNPSTMHWPMFMHDPQHTGRYIKPE